jgi:signal transduction histidine kinase
MKHILHSFYARLSALFLILIVALGAAIAVLCVRASMHFADEAEQKLNQALADSMAKEFQPFLHDTIDHERIAQKIQYMTGINPRIEIYLLGSNGMIKASFVQPGQEIAMATVHTGPLDAFMRGSALPILGDDPLSAGRKKPFSVAPIEIMGEVGCYLYIILGSERYDSVASMIKNSYIIRGALRGMALVLVVTGLAGLLLFAFLTRRLRAMREVVHAFEQGNYDRRVDRPSSDEVGHLAVSFNQMADTIVASMDEIKRSDQLRRELIANVSHDLRSPLASIQGYLETILIKDDTLRPEERRQYMETVLKNTHRLSTLVGELFDLSKLDARQVEPDFEAFSIAELVQDLVLQYRPRAEEAGVHLEAVLPDHLALVYADIGLVERAISNLIDNALRYTPADGLVRIVPSNEGDAVSVRVTDTGCGIPPEDLPHIFERFYRVEKSRARDRGGAGLGLAITQKILELHGSTLAVQSKVDKGTTFSFALPSWRGVAVKPRLQMA